MPATVSDDQSPAFVDAVAGGDISELVGRLRADIVSARFRADEPLRFRPLCATYGASVSTLREALARLTAESLVEFRPNHGFRVATVSGEDLLDIIAARCEVETVALRQSIALGDDEWEARIVAAHHRLTLVQTRLRDAGAAATSVEWESRHREFHQALLAGCRSRWLIKFCETLWLQFERYRHSVHVPPAIYPQLVCHHRLLMDAALARDADKACEILAEHLTEARHVILMGINGQAARALQGRAVLARDAGGKAEGT